MYTCMPYIVPTLLLLLRVGVRQRHVQLLKDSERP